MTNNSEYDLKDERTKFTFISVIKENDVYKFNDIYVYNDLDLILEQQFFNLGFSTDYKTFITLDRHTGKWHMRSKGNLKHDFSYDLNKVGDFIYDHKKELNYGKKKHYSKLPDIFYFLKDEIEIAYFCKKNIDISYSNREPSLFTEFDDHILKIATLIKTKSELDKYINKILSLRPKKEDQNNKIIQEQKWFIPYINIIHILDKDYMPLNRYLEISREYTTPLFRKLSKCINLETKDFDITDYKVADIGNNIFQCCDEKTNTFVSNKYYIEIPIKRINSDHFRKIYKLANLIREKYFKEDKKPKDKSFHKSFILNKETKNQREPDFEFWGYVGSDSKIRLIYLIISKGLFGYPKKNISKIIEAYYNDCDYEDSAFNKVLERYFNYYEKFLDDPKYNFLDLKYVSELLKD